MACHYYEDLFREEPAWLARAKRAAERTYELSQFIVKVLGLTDIGAAYEGRPPTIRPVTACGCSALATSR